MATKSALKKSVKQELDVYIQQLAQAGIHHQKLIVFGSQTKGKARKWSDIDVCVISKQFGKDRHDERVKLMNITNDHTINIEPHPMHPKDLEDKWNILANEIRKYGIVYEEKTQNNKS